MPETSLPSCGIPGKLRALKIPLIYLLFGIAYVFFSDSLLEFLVADKQTLVRISIVKGWVFLCVTAAILYWLIQRDMKKIRQSAEKIVSLNADLERHAQEVDAINADLKSANKALEAFNSTISHDLRAPLANIHACAQLILDTDTAAALTPGEYADIILRQATRMGLLIDSLLDFSRASRQELKREMVSLSELAQDVVADLRQRHPESTASFTIREGITACGDRQLLQVVVVNLLENALKYSSKQRTPEIEFGLVERDGREICFVRDNGVGFDMAQAQQLFESFRRFHSDAEFEGTGIGLATVRQIVERHGGTIWGDGEVGKGATFYFTLG